MRTLIRKVVDVDDPLIDITKLKGFERIKASIIFKYHNSNLYLKKKDADENAKLAKQMKRIDDLKSVLLRTLDRNFKKDVLSMRISVDRGFEDVIDDVLDSVDFICYDVKQLTVNSDYLVAFPNTPIMLEITRRG